METESSMPAQAAEFIRREKYQVLEELKRSLGSKGKFFVGKGCFGTRSSGAMRSFGSGHQGLSQMRPGRGGSKKFLLSSTIYRDGDDLVQY